MKAEIATKTEVRRSSTSTNSGTILEPDFNYIPNSAKRTVPSGQKTHKKVTGAEEIAMIGVQLPVTALGKAMIVSGLMWLAIGYQAFVWLN